MFDGVCLSGGAQNGAYQAGVLKALWEESESESPQVNEWSGVSVGAINAAFMAQGRSAQELCDLWLATETQDVLRSWCFGWARGFFKGGLYDVSPLRCLIYQHIDPALIQARGAHCSVGVVSLTTGEYRRVSSNEPHFLDFVLASSCHPVAMVQQEIEGELWTDGGVRHASPVMALRARGMSDILAVVADPASLPRWTTKSPNIVQRSLRELEIVINEAHADDVRLAHTVIRPQSPLPTEFLEFDPLIAAKLINMGYDDWKNRNGGTGTQ